MAQFDHNDNDEDLISLDDAVEEFNLSRRTLLRLIDSEGLKRYKRLGDRKHYVSRAALNRRQGFREVPSKYDPSPPNPTS